MLVMVETALDETARRDVHAERLRKCLAREEARVLRFVAEIALLVGEELAEEDGLPDVPGVGWIALPVAIEEREQLDGAGRVTGLGGEPHVDRVDVTVGGEHLGRDVADLLVALPVVDARVFVGHARLRDRLQPASPVEELRDPRAGQHSSSLSIQTPDPKAPKRSRSRSSKGRI